MNSAFTSPPTIINIPISNQHLVRNNQDNNFNNYRLTNISSVTVNHNAVEDNDLVTTWLCRNLYMRIMNDHEEMSGLAFYDENDDLVKNNHNKRFQ